MTEIYWIEEDGNIIELLYSLPPKEALKSAVLFYAFKRRNTLEYEKIDVPLKERNGRYLFIYGSQSFCTKRIKKDLTLK